ncbi:MAG: RHS repeat-associated core domain-containing protein [Deltaproteobacteria bacterium]|nr:RHS repeat-associated core domain-containing protein [Deltaproteobacteria bacterium]
MKTFLQNGILGLFLFLCVHVGTLQASVSFYHSDLLQSSQILTDEQGNPKMISHFTPYGEEIQHVTTASADYLYTGQELDRSSELYYLGARYYDPVLCALTSQDPLLKGEIPYLYLIEPGRLNGYSYTRGRPITRIDLEGMLETGQFPEMVAAQSNQLMELRKVGGNVPQGVDISTLHYMIHGGDQLPKNGSDSVRGTFQLTRTGSWEGKPGFFYQGRSQDTGAQDVEVSGPGGNSGNYVFEGGANIYNGLAFTIPGSALPEGSPIPRPSNPDDPVVIGYSLDAPLTNFHAVVRILRLPVSEVHTGPTVLVQDPKTGILYTAARTDGLDIRLVVRGSIAVTRSDKGPGHFRLRGDEDKLVARMQQILDQNGIPFDIKGTLEKERWVTK